MNAEDAFRARWTGDDFKLVADHVLDIEYDDFLLFLARKPDMLGKDVEEFRDLYESQTWRGSHGYKRGGKNDYRLMQIASCACGHFDCKHPWASAFRLRTMGKTQPVEFFT